MRAVRASELHVHFHDLLAHQAAFFAAELRANEFAAVPRVEREAPAQGLAVAFGEAHPEALSLFGRHAAPVGEL